MAKVPMQFFILFIGAMVFVFFIFERPPLLFQPVELKNVRSDRAIPGGGAPLSRRPSRIGSDAAEQFIQANRGRRSGRAHSQHCSVIAARSRS